MTAIDYDTAYLAMGDLIGFLDSAGEMPLSAQKLREIQVAIARDRAELIEKHVRARVVGEHPPWCEQSPTERAIRLLRSARQEITPVRGETEALCDQIDATLAALDASPPVVDIHGVDAAIAIWSMRPAPGTPTGVAWEQGCRQGYEWGRRSRVNDADIAELVEELRGNRNELIQNGTCAYLSPRPNGLWVNWHLVEKAIAALDGRAPKMDGHAHDWQPHGGGDFESHPGGEAPHLHTTCSKCGTQMWFLEHQWAAINAACAPKEEADERQEDRSATDYRRPGEAAQRRR